jgi:hypothetical protein
MIGFLIVRRKKITFPEGGRIWRIQDSYASIRVFDLTSRLTFGKHFEDGLRGHFQLLARRYSRFFAVRKRDPPAFETGPDGRRPIPIAPPCNAAPSPRSRWPAAKSPGPRRDDSLNPAPPGLGRHDHTERSDDTASTQIAFPSLFIAVSHRSQNIPRQPLRDQFSEAPSKYIPSGPKQPILYKANGRRLTIVTTNCSKGSCRFCHRNVRA